MNKQHWNSINPNGEVEDDLLKDLLDKSYHLVLGGFCFGAVFMATDPVTSARTEGGKYIYGLLIGIIAVTIRVLNPGYPEGMMFAILMMNMFAPAIDYCFVQSNVRRRMHRVKSLNK